MTYNDAYKLHEFCEAAMIDIVFCGIKESTNLDQFRGNDSLCVRITCYSRARRWTGTFMEREPALAFAQCLFLGRNNA